MRIIMGKSNKTVTILIKRQINLINVRHTIVSSCNFLELKLIIALLFLVFIDPPMITLIRFSICAYV